MRKLNLIKIFILSLLACITIAESAFAGAYHYNWPQEKKDEWKIATLSSSQVQLAAQWRSSNSYGEGTKNIPDGNVNYYVQGGVVTEKHYVFAVFKGDNSQNFVYFADRSTGKIVKTIKGNWGHMNTFYYTWGTKHVRVESDDGNDGCFNDDTFASISTKDCKTKRSPHYGSRGLTAQGDAHADGYVYNTGWDSGNSDFGQKWYHERDCNALFIYKEGSKELVKTLYIPKSVANGEIEDVSVDGNGDIYLFYNLTHTNNGAGFYRVSKEAVGTTKDHGSSGGNKQSTQKKKRYLKDEEPINLDPFAESSCATILSAFCDEAKTDGEQTIIKLLAIAATTMTIGIGVLCTIGLIRCGFTIMTAGDNASKIIAAKNRFVDILIGLFLWVLLTALIGLLLPTASSELYQLTASVIISACG